MEKKKILILGAGISGLSLAYYLSQSNRYEVAVLEKSLRPGGWADTDTSTGYFFENGPRTFLAAKSLSLLTLAKEIGLEQEIVASEKDARGRWLWIDGELKKVPIWSLAFIKALLTEWLVPRSILSDETVWDFACRRFNSTVAHHLFDPMCIGIHAGDMHELSIRCCFPGFKLWEEKFGSLTKGFFKTPRTRGPYLIGFRKGVSSFVTTLAQKIQGKMLYDQEVQRLSFLDDKVEAKTQHGLFQADVCFSALPCQVLGNLLSQPELLNIKLTGTTVVNFGYPQNVLNRKGFGYIVSSQENDEVLGVVFNSNAFPQHSQREGETRLTVKLRRTDLSDAEAVEIALSALKKHLGIYSAPQVATVVKAKEAFPQMKVGYRDWIGSIEEKLEQNFPRLKLVGNYLSGVGVNDCIARAKSVSDTFLSTHPS